MVDMSLEVRSTFVQSNGTREYSVYRKFHLHWHTGADPLLVLSLWPMFYYIDSPTILKPLSQELAALEPTGLLSDDPLRTTPLVSEHKAERGMIQYTWCINTSSDSPAWSQPHSITPTSPGAASNESVASDTGVGGHSVHWSQTITVPIYCSWSFHWSEQSGQNRWWVGSVGSVFGVLYL